MIKTSNSSVRWELWDICLSLSIHFSPNDNLFSANANESYSTSHFSVTFLKNLSQSNNSLCSLCLLSISSYTPLLFLHHQCLYKFYIIKNICLKCKRFKCDLTYLVPAHSLAIFYSSISLFIHSFVLFMLFMHMCECMKGENTSMQVFYMCTDQRLSFVTLHLIFII